jgi:hypothetical protein
MYQTFSLDEKTLLIKAERESDLSHIFDFLTKQQNREKNVNNLLQFAAQHRIIEKDYNFNRSDCYVR